MLDSSILNEEISISGYDIVRKDRNRHGGGVAIVIRWEINYKIRNDLMNKELETITVEILPHKSKAFLVNTGIAHQILSFNVLVFFEEYVTKIDSENKEIILVGDYNCNWTKLLDNNGVSQTVRMKDIADTFQFDQLIREPTRVTESSSRLIDLAFTNQKFLR